MALLAQHGPRRGQQRLKIGPVRIVAVQAVLAHGCMLEQEGPAFLGVAAVANFIDAIGLEKRRGRRAMRIVAIHTGNLSLQQRHVRALVEFGALYLVAGKAGLIDGLARRKSMSSEIRHRVVAIAACKIVGLVN